MSRASPLLSLVILSLLAFCTVACTTISPSTTGTAVSDISAETTASPPPGTPVSPTQARVNAPVVTPTPTATFPALFPQPATQTPRASGWAPSAVPIAATASWKTPWQYYSGSIPAQGMFIYRIRYPAGWNVYPAERGAATLQNLPAEELIPGGFSPGMIKLEISATFGQIPGSLLPPNTRTLAAGRPGTRQVLVDTGRSLTIWNVRLYGLMESAATLNLTGALYGSPDEVEEGIRLLDAMLATVEVYAWPDATPTAVALDGSISDNWQTFSGVLAAGEQGRLVSFRFPNGWWANPYEKRWVDVTNFVVDDRSQPVNPLQPGMIRLTVGINSCAEIGGCPTRLSELSTGWRGTREVRQNSAGETQWLVTIYHEDLRLTLHATLGGAEREVNLGIQALEMLLRTLTIR